jgi:hypothetical protein
VGGAARAGRWLNRVNRATRESHRRGNPATTFMGWVRGQDLARLAVQEGKAACTAILRALLPSFVREFERHTTNL